MLRYVIVADYMPDGKYRTKTRLKWHEKIRLKLALWLFQTVRKNEPWEITTGTGISSSTFFVK